MWQTVVAVSGHKLRKCSAFTIISNVSIFNSTIKTAIDKAYQTNETQTNKHDKFAMVICTHKLHDIMLEIEIENKTREKDQNE